ncbi:MULTISPECIES: tetratricopeptide repeat protein [Fusobacterium]|jgi:tetratricopeptide (TPR) repeat protein|uniref:Tetratricopeptide repeat protein n=1 Tax=Fusobacterium hominis TaxID=2764326 RepID=A0A7G9GZ40_9FUSO|nr:MULTISPECIES: tetratricopeptide repeat protein [Fusobacterium]QNM16072.1 tetratricopeptide repeat protein [Fusobacterium hominis]
MKRFAYLCIILGLCSCTNLDTDFSNVFESVQKEQKEVLPELKTEKIVLNVYAPEGILKSISDRLKSGYVREYTGTYRTNYEVYVGDYVSIPLNIGEDTYNVVSYPNGVQYDIQIKDNKLRFRSLYQGNYELMLYSGGAFSRKIKIDNKLNYEFTEQNNYDIISQSYAQRNLKGLNDGVAIHRIAFPNSFRDKELSFLLIDLAAKDGNTKIIKDEINFLKKNISLSEYDKLQLIKALEVMQGVNYEVPSELLKYNDQSQGLNMDVAKLIMNKPNIMPSEAAFLEIVYKNTEDNKQIGQVLGKWYTDNGNAVKGRQYLNNSQTVEFNTSFGNVVKPEEEIQITQEEIQTPAQSLEEKNYAQYKKFFNDGKRNFDNENYVEAVMYFEKALGMDKGYNEQKDVYFYMGQSHFRTGDYSKAVTELKKSLNLEKNGEKKAEIYYNIGMLYEKLGDKDQARNYFTYVIQNYKDSPWSVKSSMKILQQ